MRIMVVWALPLSLATFSVSAWDDLSQYPVDVDISSLSESLPQKAGLSEPDEYNRIRFDTTSRAGKVDQRFKGSNVTMKDLLESVSEEVDKQVRSSMSKRGERLYDGVIRTGTAAWTGYSFVQGTGKLSFSLRASKKSKAKFSFDKYGDGSFVYTYQLSPKSDARLTFEATNKDDADGVFLKYTKKLH